MVSRCWPECDASSPATYLKVCAMLVPRELKIAHSGDVKDMTDEQLEQGIEAIKAMLAAREAGEGAKVIEGEAQPVSALPAPKRSRGRGSERKLTEQMAKGACDSE
jgi:hypothetical protein